MPRATYVYILTNKNRNVMYVGVTSELERRIMQHRSKALDGFTARYNVDRLVYVEEHPSPSDAIAREKQLKGWSRSKKNVLVGAANPEWKDLSANWWAEGDCRDEGGSSHGRSLAGARDDG
ncbi:GIY-YIG nuclease family protein [Vineibacter terrae]|uniref:GIY-YIG nuclease family protein n=1 Tax=Vineibacter terrae TaxID=2586908 RepID=A0A5C8PPB3_9HYPH|nr:GIY-YIG nuclease family protein [Vineibacter terrae]